MGKPRTSFGDSASSERPLLPTIAALLAFHERLREAELARAQRLLRHGVPAEKVIDQLASRLTNKFLDAPTRALSRAGSAHRAGLLALLEGMYAGASRKQF